ncbi:SpoIIE family protein phosphatase [Paenalkalicoccus suaedae]|uniref:SpoIIE family protein phosphatase n=1 Tax=Paenalkalicoccus suaedae TaxID=2592382 RepID=A0A859FBJ3_9BACI|nr:SpoIIE family protein phosphatase [Paenalkalicoccus suaedae]QKS70198.1 SpoIIE family protein phosphatase [Paenalkalicoccus suaedae]
MIEHQHLREIDVSIYQTAKNGNWCSGDGYLTLRTDDFVLTAVADGLGSGEEAMHASSTVMKVIEENSEKDLLTLMDLCNNEMFGTRGVVLTILKFHFHERMIEYCNVGNIACVLYRSPGKVVRPLPSRGFLSGRKKKFFIQQFAYEKDMLFLLHSDGFKLLPVHHTLFSGVERPQEVLQKVLLMMDNPDDDTTVLVGKIN